MSDIDDPMTDADGPLDLGGRMFVDDVEGLTWIEWSALAVPARTGQAIEFYGRMRLDGDGDVWFEYRAWLRALRRSNVAQSFLDQYEVGAHEAEFAQPS